MSFYVINVAQTKGYKKCAAIIRNCEHKNNFIYQFLTIHDTISHFPEQSFDTDVSILFPFCAPIT